MNSAQTIVAVALWGTAVVALAIAIFAWRRRSLGTWAISFAILCLAIAEWSFAYSLEIMAATQQSKLFGQNRISRHCYCAGGLVVFSLQYTNRAGWLTRRWLLVLCISPILTLLFVFTNELHGLIWTEVGMDYSNVIPVLATTHGLWFWIHSAYSYTLIIAGAVMLVLAFSRYPRAYRWQNATLVGGALLPLIANAIFLSGVLPIPHLDYTTFAFALSALLMANAIFRYRLFELVPVARRTAVDNMRDGLLVLDLQNRVVDINPAALKLFQRSASEMIGYPLRQFLQNQATIMDSFRDVTDTETEIAVPFETGFVILLCKSPLCTMPRIV
ncbi:MAG: PAS domain-containing protein [Anaerolineae bacterium]|nr:PAS domain-containing protein [Anaerolineae bacterium]